MSALGAAPRLALWLARRYLLAGQGYPTVINWVSFVGLALGVMVLTVVLCVLNGFDREIKRRVLAAVPHAVVVAPVPAAALRRVLGDGPEAPAISRYFQGEAMLAGRGAVDFLTLAGVDSAGAEQLAQLLPEATRQRLFATAGGIVLGDALAATRRIGLGDEVLLVVATPAASAGTGIRPRLLRFQLAGTLADAHPEVGLAVVRHDDLARRGLLAAGVDGWRLHFADPLRLPAAAAELKTALGDVDARFWMDDYGALFRAVKIEKAIMFALLALIVAIAAFNIVSGQAMLVNNKRGDVAMLATLGASRWLLVGVFMLQGFAVAAAGVAGGLGGGVLLAANAGALLAAVEGALGASLVPGVGATLPSVVQGSDLAAIAALALGLSALAVAWPALKVAREDPADALHAA